MVTQVGYDWTICIWQKGLQSVHTSISPYIKRLFVLFPISLSAHWIYLPEPMYACDSLHLYLMLSLKPNKIDICWSISNDSSLLWLLCLELSDGWQDRTQDWSLIPNSNLQQMMEENMTTFICKMIMNFAFVIAAHQLLKIIASDSEWAAINSQNFNVILISLFCHSLQIKL